MSDAATALHKRDKWIPRYFILFFLVIAATDAVMVTLAVRTHTGVVTENAYEKGLAYNALLKEAQDQESLGIHHKSVYENGTLSWRLTDADGQPVENAEVTVMFYRAARAGSDFGANMTDDGDGVYTLTPSLPAKGEWTARMKAVWKDKDGQEIQYHTAYDLVAQ